MGDSIKAALETARRGNVVHPAPVGFDATTQQRQHNQTTIAEDVATIAVAAAQIVVASQSHHHHHHHDNEVLGKAVVAVGSTVVDGANKAADLASKGVSTVIDVAPGVASTVASNVADVANTVIDTAPGAIGGAASAIASVAQEIPNAVVECPVNCGCLLETVQQLGGAVIDCIGSL